MSNKCRECKFNDDNGSVTRNTIAALHIMCQEAKRSCLKAWWRISHTLVNLRDLMSSLKVMYDLCEGQLKVLNKILEFCKENLDYSNSSSQPSQDHILDANTSIQPKSCP